MPFGPVNVVRRINQPEPVGGRIGPVRWIGRRVVGRELLVGAFVIVHGEYELLEIVGALNARGGSAYLLHGRDQQRNQDRDDGDDDQQFDEGETTTGTKHERTSFLPGSGRKWGWTCAR